VTTEHSRSWRLLHTILVAVALLVVAAVGLVLLFEDEEDVGNLSDSARWSVFEDHSALIRSDAKRRQAVLLQIRELGADTLRVLVKWNEVAPQPNSARRPSFDATDPSDYPGFGPYDDLVERADDQGFRLLLTLSPEAPRWASEGKRPITPETVNFRPDPSEFGNFASAVARRYSGHFRGLPAVHHYSIWNEPNHQLFLKPNSESPRIYRELVRAALPKVRAEAPDDAKVLVGETAPVGRPGNVMGPGEFLRRWLCLDEGFQPLTGAAEIQEGCVGFDGVEADGFAHHPYGPAQRVARRRDVINLLAIRSLGSQLDRAAVADRLPAGIPIYSTEFGLQSNPPDPLVSTTLARQAQTLNEKEEFSYRYTRLRSYSQYLLYDDPPRPGTTPEEVWSGFQTGLRFTDGRPKPALQAYRLPIVVTPAATGGVTIWGRVRPGAGTRSVQLEIRRGAAFVADGGRISTDDQGYFEVKRPVAGSYRFAAYAGEKEGSPAVGISRVAKPVRQVVLR
jgi:hypothetical protein